MLNDKYKRLFNHLTSRVDRKRIYHDPLHTIACGMDASLYRLVPELVIKALNESEVSFILESCSEMGIPVTFRAAGTSLSGQAVTDSVLLIAGSEWSDYRISDNKEEISLQPGITGGRANALLAPYGRKIGPDPASINAAMIGGIAANNASGMCCGTARNSYKTVSGIRIVFADGSILDTKDPSCREAFLRSHGDMIAAITNVAEKAKDNLVLAERIRRKYKMKNTTGYSLNALVDFNDPFDIIEHLMIGSEGTLGFISRIDYRTVPEYPFRASSLMIFPDMEKACTAVTRLKPAPVSAVELIDRAGLRSVENETGMPQYLRELKADATALLVETVASDSDHLNRNIKEIKEAVKDIPVLFPVTFTDVPLEYEKLWKIRKGLFPSVGGLRRTGTTVIIEDVAFPVPSLANATLDLQYLLKKHGYEEAVIFGHALEGNLHFVFTQDFGTEGEIQRYADLISDVSEMVVNKYDGSLKAEHGTGRNMAPFVEMEWGREAYELMVEIKKIFDPQNILNPGVILNSDSKIHLKNLKPVPASDEITDKCTECGFCEPACVSAGLTLTPRQRIIIHREMTFLERTGRQPHILASLSKDFAYEGDKTCATDGLCAIACPIKIDCGKMIKNLRSEHVRESHRLADLVAGNMNLVTAAGRVSLAMISFFHTLLGTSIMKAVSSGLRSISRNTLPAWNMHMPAGAVKLKYENFSDRDNARKVVYFPSCINRTMGVSVYHKNELQLSEKIIRLLNKAGYDVIYPDDINNLCCGMAFLSKGYSDAGMKKSAELEKALIKASKDGLYPILCDMSPCLYTMRENIHGLKMFEPVEFITEFLVPFLHITPLDETITVFPVCSMKKMGLQDKLISLAKLCAREVVVADTNCCGFAGDRGFTFPELNRHGLRHLRSQVPAGVRSGYSNSRTCEIGLSLHSGVDFKSIVYLVDKVSEKKLHSPVI